MTKHPHSEVRSTDRAQHYARTDSSTATRWRARARLNLSLLILEHLLLLTHRQMSGTGYIGVFTMVEVAPP